MSKKKKMGLLILLVLILGVFIILASLGGSRLASPVPEEPHIIWIKPSMTPTPLATATPSPSPSAKPKVAATPKPSPSATP